MHKRQQSSTAYPIPFYMVLSSDHLTPATGKTVALNLSKNGAAPGAAAGAVTEIGNGWYALVGNATDRATLGALVGIATATACDQGGFICDITVEDPYANVTQSGDAFARIGAAGAGLTAIGDTRMANLDAAVSSAVSAASAAGSTASTINTKIGTPAGASVSADIGAVSTKIGTPSSSVSGDVATVNANVLLVKTKTDNLPADPADNSDVLAAAAAVPAATLVAFQASVDWKTIMGDVLGPFTATWPSILPGDAVLDFKDVNGNHLKTITLTLDASGNVTDRVVSA